MSTLALMYCLLSGVLPIICQGNICYTMATCCPIIGVAILLINELARRRTK